MKKESVNKKPEAKDETQDPWTKLDGESGLKELMGLENISFKRPPIENWNPDRIGEIDIVIDSDGTWWHEGSEFKRQDLVRLFASILLWEDGEYYLITPVEKLKIQVEDVPFLVTLGHNRSGEIAQEAEQHLSSNQVSLVTNIGEEISLNSTHFLECRDYKGYSVPYVRIRNNLWARVSRNLFYEMANWLTEFRDEVGNLRQGLISENLVFPFDREGAKPYSLSDVELILD